MSYVYNYSKKHFQFHGYSGKSWNTSDNPNEDEEDNSYIMNSASQPAEHSNETFINFNSDNISSNSIHNMALVTDSSTVSSFIESQHSPPLNCKYSDEAELNQINGQIQFESVSSTELPSKPDEIVSSVPRCSKRRNSLPSDYPIYKRRISVDYEVQSLCGTDVMGGSDSNSSSDTSRLCGNEEDLWTNCYAPYRKRPTSVVSSERGSESLIDKLFSEEQKRRYQTLRKKPNKRMDSKRRKDKNVDFGKVYKSFVEGITHSSPNLSLFNIMDASSKNDVKMYKAGTKRTESTCDGDAIHGIVVDVAFKDSHLNFTTDSIPEETDTDLIPKSDNPSANAVSNQQGPVLLNYDSVDEGHSSDVILVEISSTNNKECTELDNNSKDSHQALSTAYSIPEETDTNLISESDSLSFNVGSNEQDAIHMDYVAVDDGHSSNEILVQISSDNNFKDSRQAVSTTCSISEETDTDLISESDSLSVNVVSNEQDAIHMDYVAVDDSHLSDDILVKISSTDKVCSDIDDNSGDSHQALSTTYSIPEDTRDSISESDSLSVNVVSNEQGVTHMNYVTVDEPASGNILEQISSSSDKVCIDVADDSTDSQQPLSVTYPIQGETNTDLISESNSLDMYEQGTIPMDCDAVDDDHTSEKVLVQNTNSDDCSNHEILVDADNSSKDLQQIKFIIDAMPEKICSEITSEPDYLAVDQDVIATSCDTDGLLAEKDFTPAVSPVNSQQVISVADSMPNEADAVISESEHSSAKVDFNKQDVLVDFHAHMPTSENVLVSDVSSDKVLADTDNYSKDSHNGTFITDSFQGGMNTVVISDSDDGTVQTNSNQQFVMSTTELTSENVLVSSATLIGNGDNLDDSQQVIFITDSMPEETDTEIRSESDFLASHAIANDQNVLVINSDVDQPSSDDVLVYVPCEGGYRLCKISNLDLNSEDYQQVTYITETIPNEADGGLIEGSNYYIINTDPNQPEEITSTDNHTSESVLVPVADVLLNTEKQNIDLKMETNETHFSNPVINKEGTNNSAGNLTTDEISDSLDKIFTQTTESDVLYSTPEEQREMPFDFGGKLISINPNISTQALERTFTVINSKSCAEIDQNLGDKGTISSAEYYLENKSSVHNNQESIVLVEDENGLNNSVVSPSKNPQIKIQETANIHVNQCLSNTENVLEIESNQLNNTAMEVCYEDAFDNSNSVSANQKSVVYEEQEDKSAILCMDTCENDNTNEICRNILELTSDISSKKVHMDELVLVNMTKSSNALFESGIKNNTLSNKQLDECIEKSMAETVDFKGNHLHIESSLESKNSVYKCRTSKARKSILKSSEGENLKVIENVITNEAFNIIESKENLFNHNNSLVPQNNPTQTYTLSSSDVDNLPLGESCINFDLNMGTKTLPISKSFKTQFNGKHKNGTAKKSCSKSSNRSTHEMSDNYDVQNSGDDPYLSDFNYTKMNNPAGSFSPVDLSVMDKNLERAKHRTALKTFKKPFTVAKKSVTEKSSYKTIFQSYFGIRTAKKTCNKSPNKKLLPTTLDESSSSVEELSADEAKNSTVIWSPVKDLKLKVCSCSAIEVPCICNNGEQLQSVCEAEDTIDEKVVPCTKSVSQQYLLTPSSEIKHRAFCDIHFWRLKNHHCCPKCGIFCTQGSFLCCSYDHPIKERKENHIFHLSCFLVPDSGLPPGCPHCCTFSNFKKVNFSLTEKSPEETRIPNKSSEEHNITEGVENYTILMKTQNIESETVLKVNTVSTPPTQDLKRMLMAITKEPSLRLRPTGKCLFNPIKIGDVKKVIQLIANGVDPNHKFNQHKNNTPLHVAAFYGSIGIVHILIQYGASIDAVNDDLETPFVLAVEKDQMAVVRYLIHAGAEINVKNENGLTAFHVACKNNSREMAEFLYNSGNFDINLQDDGGWTPLVWACEHNYGNLVQWLLDHGADPNVHDNEQNTALHWAACSGNSEILEMLLDNGCNLSFVNQRGDSALHIAARKDNWACVKLLLARNALLDCTNKDGETPVMCCDEDFKSLKILNKHALSSITTDSKSFQHHVVYRDISRGCEKYPIQAVNEVDQEEFIMDFRYITRNCFASNVTVISTVDSMQKCACKDNCSTSNCICTRISKCWYDMDGCLLSDFDMYDPPSLYECNKTCHCPKSCINRVVQKGLSHPLQLFRTLNRGWGIRCLKDLARGTFVCEYVGEVISEDEINQRADDTYLFDLESKTGDNCIDGRFYGNIARFINHSCEPNLVSIRVFIEHQDLNFPRIAFFTMKDIKAFEELCFDYGTEFWVAKCQSVLCTCNSSLCKYSKDSIDATLQAYINEKEEQTFSPMDVQLT